MPYALVQKSKNSAGGGTSISATLPGATVAGSLLVVSVSGIGGDGTRTVSDGINTYTQRFAASGTGQTHQYQAINTGSGSRTVTVTGDTINNYVWFLSFSEWSGANATPTSGTAASNSGASSAPSTGS